MLATTTSRRGSSSRSTSARRTSTSTPFAVRSRRRPRRRPRRDRLRRRERTRAGRQRRRRPRSRSPRRGGSRARAPASSSMHARVVGCAPVPNARPGSTTTDELVGRRRDPRRADPEAAGAHRAMELLPAVFPAGATGSDRTSENAARTRGLARRRRCRRRARRRGVEPRSSSPAGKRSTSHAAASSPRASGTAQRDAAEPAQRSALFRRPKKPSSSSGFGCVGLGAERPVDVLEQAALLVVEGGRHRDVEPDVERAATRRRAATAFPRPRARAPRPAGCRPAPRARGRP